MIDRMVFVRLKEEYIRPAKSTSYTEYRRTHLDLESRNGLTKRSVGSELTSPIHRSIPPAWLPLFVKVCYTARTLVRLFGILTCRSWMSTC